jgi:NAD(P)-dependent dehydrogenase (short-subunit alcohol dehydrogenase family)
MAPLVDKKVVIIGGTSGIGFAVAKAVLAEGGHVVIGSSSNDKVRAAAKRLTTGDRVTAEVVDISREESVKALFEKVGKFEHLVITVCSFFQRLMIQLIMSRKAGGIGGAATSFPTGDLGSLKEKAFDARFWGAYSHSSPCCRSWSADGAFRRSTLLHQIFAWQCRRLGHHYERRRNKTSNDSWLGARRWRTGRDHDEYSHARC